ncbi:MAG: hypothetical protein ACOYM9_10025 [Bradymonadia bacterium]
MKAQAVLWVALTTTASHAASLPPHDPISTLVIGDEVNPHRLSDADLTQPRDLVAALEADDSGLVLTGGRVTDVNSQCIDAALAALGSAEPPDVVVYFAHLPARGCAGQDQQPALTAALERHLTQGRGVVVFHHGLYQMPGKEAILQLLGGFALGVSFDRPEGQRVLNVAGGHFVSSNAVAYPAMTALAGLPPVPDDTYPAFQNLPDERYPDTQLLTQAGESRTILFATPSGGPRILGFDLQRAGWLGRVVFYQPGEYQPNALDDRAGPNFQILANAVLYVSGRLDEVEEPPPDAGAPMDAAVVPPHDARQADDSGLAPDASTLADAAPLTDAAPLSDLATPADAVPPLDDSAVPLDTALRDEADAATVDAEVPADADASASGASSPSGCFVSPGRVSARGHWAIGLLLTALAVRRRARSRRA